MAQTNSSLGSTDSPTKISYNNRTLRSASNTPNGEVSAATIFHYHQDQDLASDSTSTSSKTKPTVWATYSGGSILRGFLIATVQADDTLNARYQHVNSSGELMTGKCRSTPEVLEDGRLRLHEKWEWTSGDLSKGESVVEEVVCAEDHGVVIP